MGWGGAFATLVVLADATAPSPNAANGDKSVSGYMDVPMVANPTYAVAGGSGYMDVNPTSAGTDNDEEDV